MLTAAEQLFLEQVNRARLDPLAEAARFGIDLNEGLASGTINGSFSRQPLAPNTVLTLAARGHSDDYQTGGVIGGHTGSDGSSPADRAERAGYGSRFVGENVGFMAATNPGSAAPAFSAAQAVTMGTGVGNSQSHHHALFLSPGHRVNMLHAPYVEAGIGQDHRIQTNPGWNTGQVDGSFAWTSSVVTSKFGREAAGDRFLTGVFYSDTNADRFYSIGEAISGATLRLGSTSATTQAAGGYALELASTTTGLTTVSYSIGGISHSVQVLLGSTNVKLDVVGGTRVLASANLVLGDTVTEGGLLGLSDLSLTGNALDNLLFVGRGNNVLNGAAGTDTAVFSGAMASYQIAVANGVVTVTDTRTGASGQGVNTLTGIERLQFADQLHILPNANPEAGTGPLRMLGQITSIHGPTLTGAEVRFVPDAGPSLQMVTQANGQFELRPAMGAAGRIEVTRAVAAGTDPAINAADALDVLRLAAGLAPSFGPAQGAHFVAADITRNGRVTAEDALEVLRVSAGLGSAHSPTWIFVDAGLNLNTLGLSATATTVPLGVDVTALSGDMSGLHLRGILLGNLDTV